MRRWLLLAVPIALASAPGEVFGQALPVRPILECVVEHGPGDFTAHFGHLNDNPEPVTIPVGSDNRFTPAPADRGQTTTFPPGRSPFFPNAAFPVAFDGSNLVWTLRSPDGSTRTSTASAGSTRCPVVESDPLQYSLCYNVSNQLGAPKPPSLRMQSVVDLFEAKDFDFTAARDLCTPVETTFAGGLTPILDPDLHLLGRGLKLTSTRPAQLRFDPRNPAHQNLQVDDAFGSHVVNLVRYKRFLTPATVCNPAVEACPADPADLPIGALASEKFKCFGVGRPRGVPRFGRDVKIAGVDRHQSRVYRVTGPKVLCLRADHEGSDPDGAGSREALMCHGLGVPTRFCEPGAPPPFSLAKCRRDADCGGSQCIRIQRPLLSPPIAGMKLRTESAAQTVTQRIPKLLCGPAEIAP